jgi:TM2 domain-containing membrane protein YozV
MDTERKRDPGLAAVFSFVFNGLGQLYNGEIAKGLVIIFLSAVSMLILIIGSILIGFWLTGKVLFAKELILGLVLFFTGLVLICILGIYSILDAHKTALLPAGRQVKK